MSDDLAPLVRSLSICFSTVFLSAACDSGGSDPSSGAPFASSSQEIEVYTLDSLPPPTLSDKGWGKYGPYDDHAVRARERYMGTPTPALLDIDNAGKIFDLIIRGPFADALGTEVPHVADFDWLDQLDDIRLPPLHPQGYPDQLATGGGRPERCDEGGTQHMTALESIDGDPARLAIEVRFDQCMQYDSHGREIYTLDGTWRRTVEIEDTGKGETFASFDALTYVRHGRSWFIDGAIYWTEFRCKNHLTRATLAIGQTNGDPIVLLDDVVAEYTGSAVYDPESGCFIRPAANRWRGTIAHREYGSVELNDQVLLDGAWNDLFGEAVIPLSIDTERGGPPSVQIIGAVGTKATISLPETGVPRRHGSEVSGRIARFTLTDKEASDTEILAPLEALSAGAFADVADADGDGLPNGWEIVYGLNHADESDAVEDADLDGLTALDEYALQSEPDDERSESRILGQFIDVSVDDYATDTIAVSVTRPIPDLTAVDDSLSVSLSGKAQWHEATLPEDCVLLEGVPATIQCSLPSVYHFLNFGNVVTFEPLAFVSNGEAVVTVRAVHSAMPWQAYTQEASLVLNGSRPVTDE